MDDVHAMINKYSMNSCEQNAIHANLCAYIAGNITTEVNNGHTDHYRPVWYDGRIRADYSDRRQQDICGDVAEDVILLSNYCRVFRIPR